MLGLFILSFVVSVAFGYLILRSGHLHAHFTGDVASPHSHKVHVTSVSRVGGMCIFLGWMVSLAAAVYADKLTPKLATMWTLCLLPAFLAGLTEDLTKRVSPTTRLLFSFLTAALAYTFLGTAVSRVDIYGIDALLAIPAVSFFFALLAIGGIAHAVNIIDGLNGLASGICLVNLFALGYVAFSVHDREILLMCGLGIGAIMGFRVWNYPSGQLFCGDGGAYFIGSYVAILSTLLVNRHQEVSAWFPLLLVLYPVWETLFSAYRRRVRGLPASTADKLHMHTLVYKRVKHSLQSAKGRVHTRRNSDASITMMMFAGGTALPAVLWWRDGPYLLAAVFAYIVLYLVIYRRLVRFAFRRKQRPSETRLPYSVVRRVAAFGRRVSRRTVRQNPKTR